MLCTHDLLPQLGYCHQPSYRKIHHIQPAVDIERAPKQNGSIDPYGTQVAGISWPQGKASIANALSNQQQTLVTSHAHGYLGVTFWAAPNRK